MRIRLIFGKTGTGKTTLCKKLINESDFKKIIIIDHLEEYNDYLIIDDVLNFLEYVKDKDEYKVSLRLTSESDIEDVFKFCELDRDILLVVEECSAYVAPRSTDTNFIRLVNFGRHWNTNIIGLSRRTAELSATMRGNTDVIYSFKQTEPIDLDKMKKLGFEGLENLEKFDYKKFNGVPVENVHYKTIYL